MSAIWQPTIGIDASATLRDVQAAARYADRLGAYALSRLDEPGAIRAIDSRLATLAITENSRAFNEQRRAIANRLAERFDLVEIWDAQLDQATCDECWGMDGKIAIVGVGFGSLEPGMVHPRCRCTSHFERRSYLQ